MAERSGSIANLERVNALMDRDGFDALVLRSGINFTYLAGFAYPGTLARHLDLADSPRGVLLVWPRHGKPALVLNSFAAPLARKDSWIERVEQYDDYGESVYAKAAAVLADLGLADGRLGLEKSYVNAAHWEEAHALLPDARISDCTAMMHRARWVKTPAEVALIEEAADLLDEAYLEVFATVRAGQSEREVHGRILESCIRRGAGWAHGILNSSRNTVVYGGEGDTTFEPGDIIRNDYVAYLRGYPGHQSRTVIMGQPSDEQRRIYRAVRDVYRATIDQCRPGVRASDVYRYAANAFLDAGFTGRVALAGHSVGAWWHQQPPFLVPSDNTVLEAGMVLALEPHVDYWHLQDMALVTDDGPRLLSDRFPTDDMLVVG